MSYHARVRDGDGWLDVLDERGQVETFERFAEAVIRIKGLFADPTYTQAEIRHADGSATRFRRGPGGEPVISGT